MFLLVKRHHIYLYTAVHMQPALKDLTEVEKVAQNVHSLHKQTIKNWMEVERLGILLKIGVKRQSNPTVGLDG